MFKLNKKRVFLGGLALILGYDALTEEKIILRNLNTIRCGLKILYNYKIRFNANNYLEVHEDVAKDIYESTSTLTQPVCTTMDSTSRWGRAWRPRTTCCLLPSSSISASCRTRLNL